MVATSQYQTGLEIKILHLQKREKGFGSAPDGVPNGLHPPRPA
jgi:hypothetical protein